MKKHIFWVALFFTFASTYALAQEESTLVSSEAASRSNTFETSFGIEYIRGTTYRPDASEQNTFKKINIGARYHIFDRMSIDFLAPLVYVERKFSDIAVDVEIPTLKSSFLGKIQVGVDSKLMDSMLGQISGLAKIHLPTMSGYEKNKGYEYFNHRSISFGLRDVFNIPITPITLSAALGYKMNAAKTYDDVTADFGDQLSMALGCGYHFTPLFSSLLELQGSKVAPLSIKIKDKDDFKSFYLDKGVYSFHVAPSAVLALTEVISMNASSRILIHRTKVEGEDVGGVVSGEMEDFGKFSVQLGLTIGI